MPSTPDRSGSVGRRRVLTVAKRECLSTITRRGYILTLVLMPLLLVGLTLLPSLSVSLSGGPEALLGLNDPDELTVVGIVDLASPRAVDPDAVDWHNDDQVLARQEQRVLPAWAIDDVPVFMQSHAPSANLDRGGFQPDARIELRLYPDEASATEAVRAQEADAAWVFPETYWETPRVRVLSAKSNPLNPGIHPGRRAAARLARASIANRAELDEPSKSRLLHVLDPEGKIVGLEGSETVAPEGEALLDEVLATLLPMLFAAFFSMLIFVASGYLLDGVGEEKESRILEILLASVTPEELLLGKMLGLGAAGLLQTLFFGLLGLIPLLLLGSISIGPLARLGMLVLEHFRPKSSKIKKLCQKHIGALL